jgi:hypothetical protein
MNIKKYIAATALVTCALSASTNVLADETFEHYFIIGSTAAAHDAGLKMTATPGFSSNNNIHTSCDASFDSSCHAQETVAVNLTSTKAGNLGYCEISFDDKGVNASGSARSHYGFPTNFDGVQKECFTPGYYFVYTNNNSNAQLTLQYHTPPPLI